LRNFILLALLAGCSQPAATNGFPFRIAAAGELAPLAPNTAGSFTLIAQDWVFEPLVRLQPDGSLKPALAATFVRVKPNLVRVEIRRDAFFSDGSQVTSTDVERSLRFFGLDAKADGENGVFIEAESPSIPDSSFLRALVFKEASGTFFGTGPFTVVEQDPSHILLRRRQRLPKHINEVLLKTFGSPRDAFTRTLGGDADSYPVIDPKQIEFFEGVPRFRLVRAQSLNAIGIALSSKRLDRETRLALLANLRSSELSPMAYPEGCAAIDLPHPTSRPLPQGRPLSIMFVSLGAPLERMALAVQRSLGARGGEIQAITFAEYLQRIPRDDFDLLIDMPLAWPHSDMALYWRTKSTLGQRPSYSNPRVDAALDAADWDRALRELMEDPPEDYICLPDRFAVVDSRIKDPRIGPYGFFETLPEWEIAP